ncbi:host attachment family protein [Labrys monachus]|uniref:Protein required for attachment to host cells n=1 Tax=Labrys monachus TaxID=217067 RepID=A0ABU0F962_9HYPH|nr:host attachment family protein [Labrys monachus]MDQ0391148.1 protein required for attachment to host cells [Labrys monachus]
MTGIRIAWQWWVLVCDGSKALLLRNEGDADLLNLKIVEVFHEHHPPSRDIGSDRPGRVFQSDAPARSATEETDWHARAEAEFIARVAAELDRVRHAQSMKHLVLVAPPKALGVLRRQLTAPVAAIVEAEIDKDLAQLPLDAIEKHLAAEA